MNTDLDDKVTARLHQIYETTLELAGRQEPARTSKELTELENAFEEFIQMHQAMVNNWEHKRETFSQPIQRKLKKVAGSNYQEAHISIQTAIDAHLTHEYGLKTKKKVTDPAMQFAFLIFTTFLNQIFAEMQSEMQTKVGSKAGKLLNLLLRELDYHEPKDLRSADKRLRAFLRRYGLIRVGSKRKTIPDEKKPYYPHLQLANQLRREAQNKGIKRTKLDIFCDVTKTLEKSDAPTDVARVQAGTNRLSKKIKLRVQHSAKKDKR